MKTTNFGFAGPVTIIGVAYLLALALAPTPGLSAQTGYPVPGSKAAVVDVNDAVTVCPDTLYARYEMRRLVKTHYEIVKSLKEVPAGRGWGGGRLTVF